jgi:hypothetical protein
MAVKTTETQKPATEPKYLADMQSALKLKHYSRRTQTTYCAANPELLHWRTRSSPYFP